MRREDFLGTTFTEGSPGPEVPHCWDMKTNRDGLRPKVGIGDLPPMCPFFGPVFWNHWGPKKSPVVFWGWDGSRGPPFWMLKTPFGREEGAGRVGPEPFWPFRGVWAHPRGVDFGSSDFGDFFEGPHRKEYWDPFFGGIGFLR